MLWLLADALQPAMSQLCPRLVTTGRGSERRGIPHSDYYFSYSQGEAGGSSVLLPVRRVAVCTMVGDAYRLAQMGCLCPWRVGTAPTLPMCWQTRPGVPSPPLTSSKEIWFLPPSVSHPLSVETRGTRHSSGLQARPAHLAMTPCRSARMKSKSIAPCKWSSLLLVSC